MKEPRPNGASSASSVDLGFLRDKVVLVTGGTGSFGRKFVQHLIWHANVRKVIVFSRDELKQFDMQHSMDDPQGKIRYFLGDVRDPKRLHIAFRAVDYIVHAAALKQVPALEYNPFEAVLTNIIGAQHIIDEAIENKVKKVVALSTDKAACPINLYGATKLCAEKLFVAGNAYAPPGTCFAVVRYGNVIGSRGSVIPFFQSKRHEGVIPITDERMTRFWITLDEGVEAVLRGLSLMKGGEIFVPKIPSMKITDLAKAIVPECRLKKVGIRPGEKIHETLMTDDESARATDLGKFYVVLPHWDKARFKGGKPLPQDFVYSSNTNDRWLTVPELKGLCESQKSTPETP